MKTRSILILTVILVFGVLVTMVLVSQSTSDTKTDSSKAAEGATGLGAKRTKPARDTQSKPPTVNVKKRDLQPVAGEKVESSEIREIRQAFSELQALKEGVGSIQQIQEKKAALQAAVERGIEKDPKSVVEVLLGVAVRSSGAVSMTIDDEVRSFIQIAPELAITLLDQLPEFGLGMVVTNISSAWAESDLKAALAWANQQADSEINNAILAGVIPSWAKTDLQGALAYAQSLPPGDSQDNLIRSAFRMAAYYDFQGTLDDDKIQGALAMMQSLPEGSTKELAASGISQSMAENDPQAAMDMATGIGDSNLRTQAQKNVVEQWSKKDPAAATQWINRSTLPQEVKTQLLPR